MLTMSDVPIEKYIPIFANTGVPVAFLVPTPTGYEKSIMDATAPIRELLCDAHIHDYSIQGQGPENKVLVETQFVCDGSLVETSASLYRPVTKKGDPRIWFSNLKRYCKPRNLLAVVAYDKTLYVFNLSDPIISNSLFNKGFSYDVLVSIRSAQNAVAEELRKKIQQIHNRGFLQSITPGDPGVGDTLEHALGISRNNSKSPDYRGIELKASRLTRNGHKKTPTRVTLFTRVPDEGMTYHELLDNYGKMQVPRGSLLARLQLYETLYCTRVNAYGLVLDVDNANDKLNILHQEERLRKYVSAWQMQNLRKSLTEKHKETFWVKAVSENRDGIEFFRYDKILHTKNPNTSLLAPLLETDKITIDLAAHYKPDGKYKDHGVLFKMWPDDLPLILGEPVEYDLTC